MRRRRFGVRSRELCVLVLLGVASAACASDAPSLAAAAEVGPSLSVPSSTAVPGTSSATLEESTTSTAAPTVPPTAPPPTLAPATLPPATAQPATTTAPPPSAAVTRVLTEQAYAPFANANGVTLHFPATRVELVGFHQSGHDGAQSITALPGVVRSFILEDRSRDTVAAGAADIVVDPDVEIRSPVTGRVLSANTYRLYCKYSDDLVFIEPDERPGWQVKVFHIDGFQVRPGQRVEAGVTVLAKRATVLPFESQVEDHGARPVWPHVHVEVVDPSVPDRPSPGGEC